jgi:hypothetical protein
MVDEAKGHLPALFGVWRQRLHLLRRIAEG